MSLRRKLTSVRALAFTSCLLAFGIYASFAPPPSHAEIVPFYETEGVTCTYAGKSYSEGACRGGQRCGNNGSGGGIWYDDTTCKNSVAVVEGPVQ